ncbi:MAG TPA: hypothetical protein VK932_06235 [Kofleriaceae bacterium]|nr:hypothetical protein [Kofleriaceae bacterium]
MQERRSRRAVAAFAAVVLILAGWLGAHHEAEVAHVRDGTGHAVHAQELADHHAPDDLAHLHGSAEHQHLPGACALLATLLARTTIPPAVAATADLAITAGSLHAAAAAPSTIAAYRLAPKTSPPAPV